MEEGNKHKDDDKISALNKPLIIIDHEQEEEDDGDISQNSGIHEERGHVHGTSSFLNTCFNGVNALSDNRNEEKYSLTTGNEAGIGEILGRGRGAGRHPQPSPQSPLARLN
ncbi:hypothetical protein PIB30_008771 [Stylosanthes scabra]|uniref:Uncharacterized protein n=1 Tax=Stylosanthes scabra TaxID=79078 RepID=A0ABU6W3L6_9FABA|nr:hypothetical protein [Stylosanthes scabra]